MTLRETILKTADKDWHRVKWFMEQIPGASRSHTGTELQKMHRMGLLQRREKGNRFEYRIPCQRPVNNEEAAEAVLSTPMPKGCQYLSNNARSWYAASSVPTGARYAKLADGSYLRRVRHEDIKLPTQKHWAPVTAAHVRTVADERWYK